MTNIVKGINSRITKREKSISQLKDRTVEINAKEKNKHKKMKRNEDSLRDLWDNIKHTNFWIIGVQEEEGKRKGYEKIFEDIIVQNVPSVEKEIVNQVHEDQSPIQDKPKEKHAKTHTNQTNKD